MAISKDPARSCAVVYRRETGPRHDRERQQRPRAVNEAGHAHELAFSGYREDPFLTERTCPQLAEAIQEAREEFLYSLWADVFMPDHVHLVVFPREREYGHPIVSRQMTLGKARGQRSEGAFGPATPPSVERLFKPFEMIPSDRNHRERRTMA